MNLASRQPCTLFFVDQHVPRIKNVLQRYANGVVLLLYTNGIVALTVDHPKLSATMYSRNEEAARLLYQMLNTNRSKMYTLSEGGNAIRAPER